MKKGYWTSSLVLGERTAMYLDPERETARQERVRPHQPVKGWVVGLKYLRMGGVRHPTVTYRHRHRPRPNWFVLHCRGLTCLGLDPPLPIEPSIERLTVDQDSTANPNDCPFQPIGLRVEDQRAQAALRKGWREVTQLLHGHEVCGQGRRGFFKSHLSGLRHVFRDSVGRCFDARDSLSETTTTTRGCEHFKAHPRCQLQLKEFTDVERRCDHYRDNAAV